jgi:putative membrane protein
MFSAWARRMKFSLSRTRLLASALTLVTLAAACGSDQKSPATAEEVREGEALPAAPPVPAEPAATGSPTAPVVPDAALAKAPAEQAPAKAALSEPQIAKVSELVNTAEVEQGKLAQGRAKAPAVKKFAAMMIKHHGDALNEQTKLIKKLQLTPADSETAQALKADGDKTLQTLKSADAASFDAVYVTSQIDGHQKVLDLLDTQLLPAAKTPEVVDALRRARGIVENHLNEARALQTK